MEDHKTPIVITSNMATGVNIIFKIVSFLARYLSEWDIEIIEAHHHRKVNSPSGSSITIGKEIAKAIEVEFDKVAKYGHDRDTSKREIGPKKEIGIHAVRAGDIVGDHTILYTGAGERIELKHQAHSRDCFATGAIRAIKFISQAKESKIYTTGEVLNLNI